MVRRSRIARMAESALPIQKAIELRGERQSVTRMLTGQESDYWQRRALKRYDGTGLSRRCQVVWRRQVSGSQVTGKVKCLGGQRLFGGRYDQGATSAKRELSGQYGAGQPGEPGRDKKASIIQEATRMALSSQERAKKPRGR